jgi:hypothetical protein
MSVSVVITNLTASPVNISELYTKLGAAGSTTAAVTISRSVAELDSMNETKALLDAGTVSVVATQSANNEDILSIALEQHGVSTPMSVAAAAEVLLPVVFAKPFPVGVVPVMNLSVDKSLGLTSRSTVYAQAITNAGFTIALDVTVLQAASTVAVNWKATY